MEDEEKTKEQLLTELSELRQRIAELETLEVKRKQAEDAMRQSENEYRTIFETTGTATIIIEEDTTISLANMEFERLSGYSKEEVEGKKRWTDFVANKDDLDRMKDYHNTRRIYPDAAPRNYEYKFMDRAGGVRDIFATIAVIPGTKRSVGSFLDITERKQAEEVLMESEQRFRDLVESSLTGICIIQDSRIVYQNKKQLKLRVPLGESLKLMDFRGIHPDDVEKVKQFYQGIISREVRSLGTDFRFYPEGKIDTEENMKWVYCQASLIKYQGKDSVLVNMMDMTKSKELERLLMMQEKMSSLGRVAAGIAHEIRNPLSGINIYLSTLQKIYDRADSLDKVKGIIGQLQSASGKIESVIRRVMDFSKPGEPKFVPTNINQPIEEALQLSSVTLRKSKIKLEKELSEDLPLCNADPHLIEEVILNLITNAAEAMKGIEVDKKIEVTSFMRNKHILVKVSDSGPGVRSDLKGKIFDPFYTTKAANTGIGLSLSHRVVTDHGGALSVGTSKWGGAEFIIEIPLEKETA
ncbi:MAG: hypothetical protein DRG73_04810 [Deltaproteobacteria bacterium]|nr:MAG: hypothetical protein DRG73_04810 [Deltaproteobacteria bacterium]